MIASNFDAGTKARNDTLSVLQDMDFKPIVMFDRSHNNIIRLWETFRAMNSLDKDTQYIVLQYPYHTAIMKIFFHKFLKLRKKYGTKVIILLHDIVYLRDEVRQQANDDQTKKTEISFFNLADYVIVHNAKMKEKLAKDGVTTPMVELGIFDYLSGAEKACITDRRKKEIVFAGNLKKEKSTFLYTEDADYGVTFNLYGTIPDPLASGFDYKGSFPPNELIAHLEGNYGLVWDGTSAEKCEGMYGEYLRYNDPHKFSLYIAAGLPVVVWKESALAEFVEREKIGKTIDGFSQLKDLPDADSAEYREMLANIAALSEKVKKGYMLKKAISACMEQ
jgi:hypothetical protein